ncbi:hypothetical protein ASC64_05915 [Nocardioides sp. Root122]|uniref:hypothetical protein n=1 Tax=Nocardioides TaxID=1839 RepID=UPI0007039DF8|nr:MULTISPECIES: hypothetical protein [Nocardioides]KQV71541.1 hypothetical protein ASC64_05915 [Nocardioides sp. Root122]MCK9822461.1 esterase-like activity of phytase family protein [Nocardioides cavernae]
MRRLAVGVVVAAPFLLGAAAGDTAVGSHPAFRFTDPEIVESSGLAVSAGLVVTSNDSGDSGRVFAVDPATGATVGVTSWADDPVDVEALAPTGDGQVWVADTGDNRHERDSVQLLRVPVGRGDRVASPQAFELVYPDGPRDAEALVSHPVTGRLYVITKGVFGGTVYAAPARLSADRPNLLEEVGDAPGIVTDATFLPGGGGVVMRTYSRAHLASFPSWQGVSSWDLPPQDQGEGVAVSGRDLLVSTEGARSRVLAVPLPPEAGATDLRSPAWTALRWLATARGLPL